MLSSKKFIDFKNGSDVYGQQWSWADFCYYLAWEGLHETEQFQTDIVNMGKKKYYDWYRYEANMESQTNKSNQ